MVTDKELALLVERERLKAQINILQSLEEHESDGEILFTEYDGYFSIESLIAQLHAELAKEKL